MTTEPWSWAELDNEQLDLVRQAEETLGADVVLVYTPGGDGVPVSASSGLRPSELDESKVDCLQGVAYQRAA